LPRHQRILQRRDRGREDIFQKSHDRSRFIGLEVILVEEDMKLRHGPALAGIDGRDGALEGGQVPLDDDVPPDAIRFAITVLAPKIVDHQHLIRLGLQDHPLQLVMELLVAEIPDGVGAAELLARQVGQDTVPLLLTVVLLRPQAVIQRQPDQPRLLQPEQDRLLPATARGPGHPIDTAHHPPKQFAGQLLLLRRQGRDLW